MNFWPTLFKLPLAIVLGWLAGYYFRDSCLNCSDSLRYIEFAIGFVPVFLWTYLLISIVQKNDEYPVRIWHYFIALPLAIILPFLVGLFLEGIFKI